MSQTIEVSPTRTPSITTPAPALATATLSPVPGTDHGRPQASEKTEAVATTLNTQMSQTTVLVPPLGQFLLSMLLQVAGLVAAVAFGIFAVKSVQIATTANSIADGANTSADKQANDAAELAMAADRLALLTLCLSDNPQIANITSICAPVINAAVTVLPKLATSLFPPSSTSAIASPPPDGGSGTPSSAAPGARVGMIAGIVVGVLVTLLLLGWLLLFRRRSRRHSLGNSSIEKDRGVVQSFRRFFMDTRLITKKEE